MAKFHIDFVKILGTHAGFAGSHKRVAMLIFVEIVDLQRKQFKKTRCHESQRTFAA
jgi:hypothetical protein